MKAMNPIRHHLNQLLQTLGQNVADHPVAVWAGTATLAAAGLAWAAVGLGNALRRRRVEARALQSALQDLRGRELALAQDGERVRGERDGLAARVELLEQGAALEARRDAAVCQLAFRMLVTAHPEWAPVLRAAVHQARQYLASGAEAAGGGRPAVAGSPVEELPAGIEPVLAGWVKEAALAD